MTTSLAQTELCPMPADPRLGLFELMVEDDVITANGDPFDLETYSRFKYGDGQLADAYGEQLADALIDQYGEILPDTYIAASPFKHVPTAAYHLIQPMLARLITAGFTPKGSFRIDRGTVKAVDYSSLDFAARQQSNAGRQVSVPDVSRRQIEGHPVIVIDDIRVSGTTEAETRKALLAAGVHQTLYGYVALLDETAGATNSSIEHRLTHAAVANLDQLIPLANSDDFRLNARTCKFILRASPTEVCQFASQIPLAVYQKIMNAIIADEYHTMPEHSEAFATLASGFRLAQVPKGRAALTNLTSDSL